jgi:hypothetical protein
MTHTSFSVLALGACVAAQFCIVKMESDRVVVVVDSDFWEQVATSQSVGGGACIALCG